MIVRMWKGTTSKANGEAFEKTFVSLGLKDYSGTPGNKGVLLLRRNAGDQIEYITLTIWDSVEAIKAFAGDDYTKSKSYDEEGNLFTTFSPFADHYDVVLSTKNLDT